MLPLSHTSYLFTSYDAFIKLHQMGIRTFPLYTYWPTYLRIGIPTYKPHHLPHVKMYIESRARTLILLAQSSFYVFQCIL